ncbi:MAG: amidohydrolase family protein [Wenzhouxiangellaceae bacterium]|nr:amidohydrolase family protein [Wenzhouxiangellaceae bacterium]
MIRWSILLLLALAGSLAAAESFRFDNVRVVDAERGAVSSPTTLHVRAGWVVAAERAEADAVVIDGQGRFVVPGLAEMHAHVPPMRDAQRVDDVLRLFLAHGVTTIRGMLGEPGHLQLRAELAAGQRIGPRLITSGPSLNGTSVPDRDAALLRVRQQAEAGYDFLKLHPGLMPDTFAAIDRAADALGMVHAGHVSLAVGLEHALSARQATIDHLDGYAMVLVPADHPARSREPGLFGFNLGDALDFEAIPHWTVRTAEAGVWNVPTQTLVENLAVGDAEALQQRPAMRYVDAVTAANWAARVEQMQGAQPRERLARFVEGRRLLIRALHQSGAGLLAGADAPQIMNVPGDALHHELQLYVDAGLSPAAALKTATANVAKFFEQPGYGCLAPGCVADLVLVEADPLADIAHLRRIEGVMRAGRWFDRAELDAMLDDIAARAQAQSPD